MRTQRFAVWFVLAIIGCSNGSPAAIDKSSPEVRGIWQVRWTLEKSSARAGSQRPASAIQGSLALVDASERVKRLNIMDSSGTTHFGVYDADFQPFGINIGEANVIPLASASDTHGDSIEVRLSPQSDHGMLVMRGRLNGDSLLGHWYQPIAGGATGRFAMHRQQ